MTQNDSSLAENDTSLASDDGSWSAVFRPLDLALVKWAMRKFKRFKGRQRRASRWLQGVARREVSVPGSGGEAG
jgi:hypothetical protein